MKKDDRIRLNDIDQLETQNKHRQRNQQGKTSQPAMRSSQGRFVFCFELIKPYECRDESKDEERQPRNLMQSVEVFAA